MNEWLTPDGAMVIFGILVFGVLPAVAYLARLAGKHSAADTVQGLQTQLAGAHTALGSVVAGVHDARKAFSPGTAKALVDILKARNTEAGVQNVLAPIVDQIAAGVDPTLAAETATKRITRRVS